MPRQRLGLGEHGRITETHTGGVYLAACWVRDTDGKRRRVKRSSTKSAEDARRLLQRHLAERIPPSRGDVTADTTLDTLFGVWLDAKISEDGISGQTASQYQQVWDRRCSPELGAVTVGELRTSRANRFLQGLPPATGKKVRAILLGMFGLAARFDAVTANPITEAKPAKMKRTPPKALTPAEFQAVREAITVYQRSRDGRGGPKPGRLLGAFVAALAATGARPNEVLALEWTDVDLLADPPTIRITGTLIDHQRVAGKPLHRQEERKGAAPTHTVVLPRFGVEAFAELFAETGPDGPVFATRAGGWVSLSNLRRALRQALPEELSWVTPHSLRRTVASVVRDDHGPAAAQQQLSHAKLATTEAHYLERQTRGPDVRGTLDRFAGN